MPRGVSLFELCSRIRRDMVRDLLKWPDHKFNVMDPASARSFRSERQQWLQTKQGKRMQALVKQHKAILDED